MIMNKLNVLNIVSVHTGDIISPKMYEFHWNRCIFCTQQNPSSIVYLSRSMTILYISVASMMFLCYLQSVIWISTVFAWYVSGFINPGKNQSTDVNKNSNLKTKEPNSLIYATVKWTTNDMYAENCVNLMKVQLVKLCNIVFSMHIFGSVCVCLWIFWYTKKTRFVVQTKHDKDSVNKKPNDEVHKKLLENIC